MYSQFLNKNVKLVYKDGKKLGKDYVRYVKGEVVNSDSKSLVLKLQKNSQLFAVSLPEIIYVKEVRIEKGIGG